MQTFRRFGIPQTVSAGMSKAALYQSRYIEHAGSGIEDVEAACAEAGLPRTTIEVRNRTIVHTIWRKTTKETGKTSKKTTKEDEATTKERLQEVRHARSVRPLVQRVARHILQYVTGCVGGGVQENLNGKKIRTSGRFKFGIILIVRTGTLWPHSFATRTAAERPAGSAIGCNRVFGELRLRQAYTWLARRYPIISGCRLVV